MQCELGARTTKPTDLMTYLMDVSDWPDKCSHEPSWWVVPWSGAEFWASHPLLQGKQWMIPWERWNWSMLKRYEPSGPYISREAAHYPDLLNEKLAEKWVRAAAMVKLSLSQGNSMVRTGNWSNSLVALHLHKGEVSQNEKHVQNYNHHTVHKHSWNKRTWSQHNPNDTYTDHTTRHQLVAPVSCLARRQM